MAILLSPPKTATAQAKKNKVILETPDLHSFTDIPDSNINKSDILAKAFTDVYLRIITITYYKYPNFNHFIMEADSLRSFNIRKIILTSCILNHVGSFHILRHIQLILRGSL